MGWRSWAVVEQRRQVRLRSVVFDTVWSPQEELVAGCNRLSIWLRLPFARRRASAHDVPFDRCSCGIHASSNLETAANYLYLYDDLRQPQLRGRAIGRVSLWGSVVEGETGWRASRAYPERLFLPRTDRAGRATDAEAVLEGLSEYGVPIEIIDEEADTAVGRAVRRVKRDRRRDRGRPRAQRTATPTG